MKKITKVIDLKESIKRAAWMVGIVLSVIVSQDASAALIASESFSTGAVAGDYTDAQAFNGTDNKTVTIGTSGFAGQEWVNGTSLVLPRWFASSSAHNGIVGSTSAGGAIINPAGVGVDRHSQRALGSALPSATSYFLSGMVQYGNDGAMLNGDVVSLGFGDTLSVNTADISDGFHLGLYETGDQTYLAAFAGGSIYQLAAVPQSIFHQIVLRLDVNASGNETLNAWYAAPGDNDLTHALVDQSVETYTEAADLSTFIAQTIGGSNGTGPRLDEMRFGTALSDVTAIPEPAVMGLMGFVSIGALFLRRLSL